MAASDGAEKAAQAKELAQEWLSVLAYPVFAPTHPLAQEYIWRKVALCKKIRASQDAAAAKAKEGGRADVAREKLLSRDREALESTLARKRNSRSILSRVDLGAYTSSTKVEALVDGLRSMRA